MLDTIRPLELALQKLRNPGTPQKKVTMTKSMLILEVNSRIQEREALKEAKEMNAKKQKSKINR